MEDTLRNFLETANPWERMETNIPSVFVVKSGATKKKPPRLMIEINPIDQFGKPTKRKGLYITSVEMLKTFAELIIEDKVSKLMDTLDKMNPKEEISKEKIILE